MGEKNQVNQEGGNGTSRTQIRYQYRNSNTTKKLSFKIPPIVFNQGRPSDAAKYEDPTKTIINYVKREYYAGVYLGQTVREGKVPHLALLTKTKKDKSKSDSEFDMRVFKWKENAKTVVIRMHRKDKGNTNIYFLFSYQ